MIETFPFDPAEYLDSEEGIEAYLADARLDGAEALADAALVVARARKLLQGRGVVVCSPSVRQGARMGVNTGKGYRQDAVRSRTQFQQPNGDWQKRNEGNGQFMERKSSDGPFKGVAKEPDGRDGKD